MATPEGTERYRARFDQAAEGHFRQEQGLVMSSIGLGTYLGEADERTDELYRRAVVRAVELGCNVIDSAINYRFQRSERSVGAALADLMARFWSRRTTFCRNRFLALLVLGMANEASIQGFRTVESPFITDLSDFV